MTVGADSVDRVVIVHPKDFATVAECQAMGKKIAQSVGESEAKKHKSEQGWTGQWGCVTKKNFDEAVKKKIITPEIYKEPTEKEKK